VSIPHEEHVVNRSAAAIAAVCIACAALPAAAGGLVDLAVINRATGQRVPVHHHQGRTYVAGTPGERYAVYVANRTAARLLTVVSVDGINAVTGETASADQNGYVLGPHQSYEIAGWRKSTSEVAAFYFTQLPDSYAARTDRPENVGVIGVAVFREYRPPRPAVLPQPRPYARSDSAAREAESSAPGESTAEARAPRRQERIGTGHGERERSDVVYTHFRRATSVPSETIAIYYDTRANLVARGIIPGTAPVSTPHPFPGERFVPDPRT
jgi:hypothetical protein